MRYFILFIFWVALISCSNSGGKDAPVTDSTTVATTTLDTPAAVTEAGEETTDDMATYYVVIADTGRDYYVLDKKMYKIASVMKSKVDTMNRYYNTEKNRIVLPDDDEDEVYAGEYFPRRFTSDVLSIEYMDQYDTSEGAGSIMALVTGVYETQTSADSLSRALDKAGFKSRVVKAEMYIGCMH